MPGAGCIMRRDHHEDIAVQELTRFAFAANIKWLLVVVMGLLAAWLLLVAWHDASSVIDRNTRWTAHPASVLDTHESGWVQVEVAAQVAAGIPDVGYVEDETPDENGNVRIYAPPQTLIDYADPALLQNPAAPAEIALRGPLPWLGVLTNAVSGLMLLGLCVLLMRSGWGQDLLWADGTWIETPVTSLPPGERATSEDRFGKQGGPGTLPLMLLLGGAALFGVYRWFADGSANLSQALPIVIATIAFGGYILAGILESRTLAVAFDDSGFVSSSFFGSKRVPWSEVGNALRRNISEIEQREYDNKSMSQRRGMSRPTSLWVQVIVDPQGREILSLPEDLQPASAFERFIARAMGPGHERQVREEADARERLERAQSTPEALRSAEEHEVIRQHERLVREREAEAEAFGARTEASGKEVSRMGGLIVLLIALPIFALTLWLSARPAWLLLSGERTTGVVVAREAGDAQAMEVEYRDASGEPHRFRTPATFAFNAYRVGDEVPVLYLGQNPDDARVAVFWGLWLFPVMLGVVSAVFGIVLVFLWL